MAPTRRGCLAISCPHPAAAPLFRCSGVSAPVAGPRTSPVPDQGRYLLSPLVSAWLSIARTWLSAVRRFAWPRSFGFHWPVAFRWPWLAQRGRPLLTVLHGLIRRWPRLILVVVAAAVTAVVATSVAVPAALAQPAQPPRPRSITPSSRTSRNLPPNPNTSLNTSPSTSPNSSPSPNPSHAGRPRPSRITSTTP